MSEKVASEDFVTLDGKVIKMDLTKLVEMDSQDIMASNKHIYTDENNSVFQNYCDLVYEPQWQQGEYINAIVLAIWQEATWGHYTGSCLVQGEVIHVDTWGFFEHVHFRW